MALSDDRERVNAVIANTASLSGAVVLGGRRLVGIEPPATFTAATVYLLFLVSSDGTNFELLRDKAGAVEYVTVAATNTNKRVPLNSEIFRPWSALKVGTYQTDKATVQAQSAQRTIPLVVVGASG